MTGATAIPDAPLNRSRWRWAIWLIAWPFWLVRGSIGLVLNPMLLKELKVSSRRKRTYFLRAAYLLVLVAALLLTWWIVIQESMTGATAELLQRQGQTGQALSLTLGWIQLIALVLIAPMLTGSCVSDEIEDRSIDVLLITPLSAGQIIVGKLLSRFAYVCLLVLLSAPLLLAMRTYGGFTLEQLIKLESLSLTTALLGSSLAILLSCWEARGWRAVAMAYFWMALWWLALPLLIVGVWFIVISLIQRIAPWMPLGLWIFDWEAYPFLMLHNNPFMVMWLLTFEAMAGPVVPWPTDLAFITTNAINVMTSAALVSLAVPLLRRTARKRIAATESLGRSWFVRLLRPRRKAPVAAVGPSIAADEPATAQAAAHPAHAAEANLDVPRVWENPVLWREMRFAVLRRPIVSACVALLLLGLLFWYNVKAYMHMEADMVLPLLWIAVIAQLVIACVVSPTTIASEKQARSWEVLLCAPVRPMTILWSKAAGALKLALLPLAALLLESLYYSTRHSVLLAVALHVALIATAFSILLACTGVLLSMFMKRSMTAMATNLALAITLWGGLPAIVGIFAGLSGGSNQFEEMFGVMMTVNPFYWLAVVTDHLVSSSYGGDATYELPFWDTHLRLADFTAVVIFVSVVVSAAGLGLLYAGSTWFNRIAGRAS